MPRRVKRERVFILFIATTRINEAGSEELASSRRVIAGYAGFLRSSKSGVRFGVRCGPCVSNVLAAKTVKTGGGGRNRTRKLYRSEPNTLCFKTHSSLILQGFKLFFRLLVQCYALPRYCPQIARQVKI